MYLVRIKQRKKIDKKQIFIRSFVETQRMQIKDDQSLFSLGLLLNASTL